MCGSEVETSLLDDHLSEALIVEDKRSLSDNSFQPCHAGHLRLSAVNIVEEDVFANNRVDFFEGFYLFLVVKTLEVGELFHHFEEVVGDKAAHLLKEWSEVFVIRSNGRIDFVTVFLEQVEEDVGFLVSLSEAEVKCERRNEFRVYFIFAHSFSLESVVSQELDEQATLVSEGFLPCRSIKCFLKSGYGELILILLEDLSHFKVEVFNVRVLERQGGLELLINGQLLLPVLPK